jgi:hypothetical protein
MVVITITIIRRSGLLHDKTLQDEQMNSVDIKCNMKILAFLKPITDLKIILKFSSYPAQNTVTFIDMSQSINAV